MDNKIERLKITDNRFNIIGIIGLGYVGLPLALSFAEKKMTVLGFDIDVVKVDKLNQGQNYLKHIDSRRIKSARESQCFEATNDFTRVKEADALILCVPTPLNKYREPDLSFIRNTMNTILPYLRKGQVISLESTTYPGTTEEELKPMLESRGFVVGKDIFLVFSPEREDPGNDKFSTSTIPKVVGGITQPCLEAGVALYNNIIEKVIPVTSTRVAEFTKLLENIYRAVNIGLVNEMKIVADKMGVDIWEVIGAASTKPFGFTPFYPGPGWGGHCIPIDPFYLTWKAREYGVNTQFIELAGEVNTKMPEWVVEKVAEALNDREKSIKGSKILILGIAYKKNIDDIRESPAVELMDILQKKGAVISYADPYIPFFPIMRRHKFSLISSDITAELLKDMDCVIVATDHDLFDYKFIRDNAALIIDTRGRYRQKYNNVIRC